MGCFLTTDPKPKIFSLKDLSSCSVRGSFVGTQLYLANVSRVTTMEDFRLSNSDFIGQKGGKIHQEYSLLDPPIGKGAFGEVRRAIHKKTNMTRAVKIVYKDSTNKEEQERLINEVNILKTLDHPNIMKIIEFYQDESYFYIVSEFFNGGELFEKISTMKNFSERRAARTIRQIISAIHYCHMHQIVHRDLKPENILYESKREDAPLKVIDFGTSRYYDPHTTMKQKFGTPYYIAPEVIKRNYNEKCDVWSCGVILYILLCGFPPFNGETDKEIMDAVSIGEYDFDAPEWVEVSDAAQNLIRNMLAYDPKDRYSSEQVLNDPWFKTVLGEETFDKPLAVTALNHLSHFKADRKLQEAVWLFLVNYMATKDERSHLLKVFQALDLNGDGRLSKEELIAGYKQIMGDENPEAHVESIMKALDCNNSGTIEYTEFVMATVNKQNMLTKENLDTIFKLIDQDGNGVIDMDELKSVLNAANQKDIDDHVWEDIIKEVDKDGDGKISYEEFVDMMVELLKQ